MARPREFDRALALYRAMDAFWELGYEATSTAVLVSRMGIRRSSLYATFGSKQELYAEAVDLYVQDLRHRVLDKLRAEGPAMDVLSDFFLAVADRGDRDGESLRCCMIVRASISGAGQPPEIRARITNVLEELDDAFQAVLQRAREEGTLGTDARPRGSARFLTTTFQGLNLAALAGRSRRELREIVRKALAALR